MAGEYITSERKPSGSAAGIKILSAIFALTALAAAAAWVAALRGKNNPGLSGSSLSASMISEVTERIGEKINRRLLLPDLEPGKTRELYIQTRPSDGKRFLRFSTTIANRGDGPLEMTGRYDPAEGKTRATQRVYRRDGSREDRLAGYFIFHEAHNHWHFEDFVEYGLYKRGDDGTLKEKVAGSGKMTFCMYDYFPAVPAVPGTPAKAAYPECDPVIQGISVGWADEYAAEYAGQELDITGLPDGRYVLYYMVDPLNRIAEKNKGNNAGSAAIEIAGLAARPAEI